MKLAREEAERAFNNADTGLNKSYDSDTSNKVGSDAGSLGRAMKRVVSK